MSELRIGTCSWKYDSWKGLVYSDQPNINYLKEYSLHFNTVEIDQWFWSLHGHDKVSLPLPHVVKGYVDSVPSDFKFSIKIPNSITLTHFYQKNKSTPLEPNPYFLSNELFEKFLDTLEPMRDFLGPLMFQFEYLNKQKMSSLTEFLEKFGKFIQKCPDDFTYAIETRNPYYLNQSFFEFLNKNHLFLVLLQGYYMPSIKDLYEKYNKNVNDLVVIRLHGPDRKGIEKQTGSQWHQIVAPKDNELDSIIHIVEQELKKNTITYVNVNNHYEGSAPLTIEKIRQRLQGFMSESALKEV